MARVPKRLALQLVDLTFETVYTVPALTKTIVRHIHINNPTGAAVTFTVAVGADTLANHILSAISVAAGAVYDLYGYFVLDAAETLGAKASADDTCNITVNGDEIVLG